jgi:uncharacterized protein YacL
MNGINLNVDVLIIRAVFILFVMAAGYFLRPIPQNRLYSMFVATVVAAAIIFFETRVRRATLKSLIGAAVGSVLGIMGASMIGFLIAQQEALPKEPRAYITFSLLIFMAYVGLMVGAAKGEHIDLAALGGILHDRGQRLNYKILDTSVIIDGRIADIAETRFLEGALVIPQFVLRELQQIADSAGANKRNRGRRGLDILHRLQNMHAVNVQISEVDFPDLPDVDMKLIELAIQLNGRIVTNDFNLNKVAQLRGVEVLNINELANALKPVVLPGEGMKVFILKEGKEPNQGVAYLDDGTMVVVDNARRMIGKTVEVSVTSVLQTTAGKMIFGRFVEEVRSSRGSGHSHALVEDR